MPFVKKPNSQGSQSPSNPSTIFIGRTHELHFFVQNILKPEEPIYNILSIWGQGGVGKSTLLKQFMNQIRTVDCKDYCLAALVDERHMTPASMMERWANQLSLSGRFGKALRRYQEALDPSSIERNTLQDQLVKKVPDLTGAALEGIPFAGPLLREGTKVTTEHLLDRYRLSAEQQEDQRRNAPIRALTQAFVTELNRTVEHKGVLGSRRAGRDKRILLFFDTFERLAPHAVPWLLDYFLEAEISTNIVLVVAGRNSIERSTPDGTKRWLQLFEDQKLYTLALKSFTEEETFVYLAERGITDPDRMRTIWHLSRGLPLYLGLLTTHPQGDVDSTKDVVDNFLCWIAEDEQVKRRLALEAALLSRPFTQDDLEAFAYIPEESRPILYRWLTTLPFVQSVSQDGRYRYHEVAQELFCRYLAQHTPKQYSAVRQGLANHYQQLLQAIGEQGGKSTYRSGEWLELALTLTFQLLLLPDEANHMKATEYLLGAFQQLSVEQYGEIAAVLRQVSQEQINNQANPHARRIAKCLLHFVETASGYQMQEKLIAANDVLEKFLHEPASTPKLQAYLYYNRGWAFFCLSEFEQALQDFDRTLELDPGYAMAHTSRGSIYWTFKKEYQRALEAYNHAIELDPTSHETYDCRGWVFYLLGEYQRALQDFDRTLELDPNYFDAYRGRGHVCRELKDYQRAITPLDYALERTPESSRLHAYRGWTYWDFGEYQQALKDFDRSIALDPHWSVSHSGRGLTLIRLKEYQQALEAYDCVLELNPNDTTAYWGRGSALSELKQYQQALDALGRAIELQPNNASAYAYRGRIYRELKEYQRSLEEFDQLVKVTLFNASTAYFQRGYAYLWVKDVKQAKADFIRSRELNPQKIDSGWMSEWCNLYQERANAETPGRLESIALVNREHYSAHLCQGVALLLCEALEKALEKIEQAIFLQPERHDAYFWKAMVCAMLGLYEESIVAIENALELELPPVLLTPLHWLEQDRPDFFKEHVGPLLARF